MLAGFGPRMMFSPFDMLWYWDPYYNQKRAAAAALKGEQEMNFLEAVFSFVFGDGDPNREFERRRWALVGEAPSVTLFAHNPPYTFTTCALSPNRTTRGVSASAAAAAAAGHVWVRMGRVKVGWVRVGRVLRAGEAGCRRCPHRTTRPPTSLRCHRIQSY